MPTLQQQEHQHQQHQLPQQQHQQHQLQQQQHQQHQQHQQQQQSSGRGSNSPSLSLLFPEDGDQDAAEEHTIRVFKELSRRDLPGSCTTPSMMINRDTTNNGRNTTLRRRGTNPPLQQHGQQLSFQDAGTNTGPRGPHAYPSMHIAHDAHQPPSLHDPHPAPAPAPTGLRSDQSSNPSVMNTDTAGPSTGAPYPHQSQGRPARRRMTNNDNTYVPQQAV